jgi:hypothetical protein
MLTLSRFKSVSPHKSPNTLRSACPQTGDFGVTFGLTYYLGGTVYFTLRMLANNDLAVLFTVIFPLRCR